MARRIAFVFPGQGAQSVGMGKDFFEQSITARAIYETFDQIVNSELSHVCFNGPEETLKQTLYTQPAILETAIAALELFREECDVTPVVTAGHSLGEYAALYASGAIDLNSAAKLVKKRCELMEAAPKGAMSAVLGLAADKIEAVFETLRSSLPSGQVITVANYNTPEQVVISGSPEAVEAAAAPLKEAGAKRVLPLPVGGAFHSPLMAAAAQEFAQFVQSVEFNDSQVPVVTNVDAATTKIGSQFQQKLGQQIDHSVRWTQTMAEIIERHQVDTVIEFGPGKVLTGMFKKCYPDVTVLNVFDFASLEATLSALSAEACAVSA